MTFEGLGEMSEGYSADTGAGKFPLVSMGGRADPSSVRRRGARTPIGASGNFRVFSIKITLCDLCFVKNVLGRNCFIGSIVFVICVKCIFLVKHLKVKILQDPKLECYEKER